MLRSACLVLALTVAFLGSTVGDRGLASACVGDAECDDANPCTDDLCDPVGGCLHSNNSAGCSDGNACTTADVCNGGTCVGGGPAAGCTPCQAAAVIPAKGGTFVGATSGTSTLSSSCGTTGSSPERVYLWTPSTSGLATIATCGSGTLYDTVLYLRRGGCGGPELACNDDTTGCATGEPNDHHGSRISITVTAGQTYAIVVDGYAGARGTYTLTVSAPSVCGNGVREGSEQCDGADAAACVTRQCTTACTCVIPTGGLPDLVPVIGDVSIQRNTTVASGDVAEGCAESTSNVDLLRFSVLSQNNGTADLVLGDPLCPLPCSDHPLASCGNPEFICSPAAGHNHPHYTNYARYELLDATSQAVVVGHKQGFCLLDTLCSAPKYSCTNQGLTAGCADLYYAALGCQYLDITGIPPGSYTLRVRMDPFGRIPELDETNNVATVPVVIPPVNTTTTTPPPTTTTTTTPTATTTTTTLPTGACAAATVVPAAGGTFTGTTSGASTLTGCVSQTGTAPERVFRWTPAVSGTASLETCGAGTTFDTVLYVRSGSCAAGTQVACNDDTTGCGTGDGCSTASHHGSRVSLAVTAGQTYWIVVDGYAGSCGGASGAFSLRITPPASATTTTVATTTSTTSTSTTSTPTTSTSTTSTSTTSTSPTTTSSSTTSSTTTSTTTSSTTTSTTTSSTTTLALAAACVSPMNIPANGGSVDGNTGGTGSLSSSCVATGSAPERVFRWTPSRSGLATFSTCDNRTDFDTVLFVYQDVCGDGPDIACNDDSCADASMVTSPVTAGTTYYIVVDGKGSARGKFKLRVTLL